VSSIAEAEIDFSSPPARRPGTPARFFLFVLAVAGSVVVLTVGFPPGARDRLPVLLLSLALALDAVFRPSAAIRDFCYVFPVTGLLASIFGTVDPVAWPVLLFGGLAVGWTFRFLYDFESVPEPSRLDRPLKALAAVWAIGAVVALARARTLWAFINGLSGRTVSGEGLTDAAAVRESLLAFAILGAGAAFFFVLRRSGATSRADASRAALLGTAVAAVVAISQAIGALPEESRPFWKLTGRLSGGATDPNALGLLCGLAIPVLLALAARRDRQSWALPALVPLPIGLALSGSRSGFFLAIMGGAAVVALAPVRGRVRAGLAIAAVTMLVVLLGTALLRGSPGDVGERLGSLFRSSLSLEDRTSSRPILWRAALRLFTESPLEGGGLGSFSWRLADLTAAQGARLPMRDNPGSAYLQALAETGILGLALTLAFLLPLGACSLARARERDATGVGAGAAILGFLLVLLVGSHWLSPEVSFLFFLLAAAVATPGEPGRTWLTRLSAALLTVYTVFAALAVARTSDPRETFRYSRLIGFHGQETGPGGDFRWTRKKFALWVPAEAPQRLALANYSPEGKPVEIRVRADGGILYRRSVRPGEAVHLALRPAGHARAFRFELDRAFVPKRLTGSDDRRELGLLAVLPEDPAGLRR
jgi:O-antigen ligase